MKKAIFISIFVLLLVPNAYAEVSENSNIKCLIDDLPIESCLINGISYLPVEKLVNYGFDVENSGKSINLKRKTIFYLDGDYSAKNTDGGLEVCENDMPVMINGKVANTYSVGGKLVIQADELSNFGTVKWLENEKVIDIRIVENELNAAFENARENNELEIISMDKYNIIGQITCQMKDGKPNGIARSTRWQEMTETGYMIDGKYEGVVCGRRNHVPYLASLYEIKSVRNGLKNGYCLYVTGYNNRPEAPGTVKRACGIYENDVLKDGEYTVYTDYNSNTETYRVTNFKEQKISSTNKFDNYEKSSAQIFYKGELISFDVCPVIEGGRTLVPVRGLFEKMGADVSWNDENLSVCVKAQNTITFKIDSCIADVDGTQRYMDIPPRLIGERTVIPLRFLAEELGFGVEWNETANAIYIS